MLLISLNKFRDVPFSKTVEKITVAVMSVVAKAVRKEVSLPLGINVLRNDGIAAYSIAYAVKLG